MEDRKQQEDQMNERNNGFMNESAKNDGRSETIGRSNE